MLISTLAALSITIYIHLMSGCISTELYSIYCSRFSLWPPDHCILHVVYQVAGQLYIQSTLYVINLLVCTFIQSTCLVYTFLVYISLANSVCQVLYYILLTSEYLTYYNVLWCSPVMCKPYLSQIACPMLISQQ